MAEEGGRTAAGAATARLAATLAVGTLAVAAPALGAGCGDDDGADPGEGAGERADRPVEPPPGWRTVRNRESGFTISVPRSWTARTRDDATLIRSADRLAVVTVAADRGTESVQLPPPDYARQTLEALPEFEGAVSVEPRRVRGSPYRSARVEGQGSLATSRRPQRVTVAAFRRPDQVTYVAVAFRNARAPVLHNEQVIDRMLRSFRAQPPA